jgi:hypothetical protein
MDLRLMQQLKTKSQQSPSALILYFTDLVGINGAADTLYRPKLLTLLLLH